MMANERVMDERERGEEQRRRQAKEAEHEIARLH